MYAIKMRNILYDIHLRLHFHNGKFLVIQGLRPAILELSKL